MDPGFTPVHGDPIAPVILGVTSILAFAIVGRVLARRLGQPTVFGELLMGILLGNVAWFFGIDLIVLLREGPMIFDLAHQTMAGAPIDEAATEIFGAKTGEEIAGIITGPRGAALTQVAYAVHTFSKYGVIFMLFMVGLQTNLEEMSRVGADSARVAVIGVLLPMALGIAVVEALRPGMPLTVALFIGATLAATSLGITANVLQELDYTSSREGRIILGAAVYDDILGLIILAIVSGIVVNNSVDFGEIIEVILVSALFLAAAVGIGPAIVKVSASLMRRLDFIEAKMFTSYLFVMVLAWVANLSGLATIVGAFAAGVVLRDSFFLRDDDPPGRRLVTIRELIMPLEVILVPIFFILVGMQVKLESFNSLPVFTMAGGLLVAAVVGKLLSGIGARRPVSKLIVGIGMMPRGEVGLVFAAIGRTLGVIDDAMFASIILMVMITTLAAPPWLKAAVNRNSRAAA